MKHRSLKAVAAASVSLLFLAACGEKDVTASYQQSQEEAQTRQVARALVGIMNVSGDSVRVGQSGCSGQTGNFGDAGYACSGSCVGSTYQVSCATPDQASKTYACGSDAFTLTRSTLVAKVNAAQLTWRGSSPDGDIALDVEVDGALSGTRVNGRLACSFQAIVSYASGKGQPTLSLDCDRYSCAIGGAMISCPALQAAMQVDACDHD